MARLHKEDTSERRTAYVSFFVTPAERDELNERAAALGIGRSEFLRIVALSDLKKPAPNARSPEVIRELANEISRVGNNINQLAKLANECRAMPDKQALNEVTESIIASLGKVRSL
jgi:DNA-binding ferritin-like protein